MQPVSMIKAAGLVHHLLILGFNALIILLYFIRSSATSTVKSRTCKAIAITACVLPFTITFLSRQVSGNQVIVIVSNLVTILGMAFSIWALSVLGRNFSIIPQARNLVQSGPYRLVRHPLYLGELISWLGIVIARLTVSTAALFILVITFQVYRAFQEENLLAALFPEYEHYRLSTPRFIPGVF